MKIKILPVNKHLKNRIHQHGDVWEIITEDLTTGRILAQSQNLTFSGKCGTKEHDLRWVSPGEFELIP